MNKGEGRGSSSYGHILRSAGIVGGSQVIRVIIGIVTTKLLAVLLGPMGVGIVGIYQSIVDVVRNITGFGLGTSSVRELAEARNRTTERSLVQVVSLVRFWSGATGLAGGLILCAVSAPVGLFSFGSSEYTPSIIIVSIVVLLTSISQYQVSLLQGMQQIVALAKATIVAGMVAGGISIGFYFAFRTEGIVFALLASATSVIAINWLFTRKTVPKLTPLIPRELLLGGYSLFRVGVFIAINAIVSALVLYVTKGLVANSLGMASVGYYQAAWTITSTYLGVIFGALLADYYPRLSAVGSDKTEVNRLVNEQTQVTLLVASPLLVLLFVFAPQVLDLLYSSSFSSVSGLLQWHIGGAFVMLLGWSVGVIFLGTGKTAQSSTSEILSQSLYVAVVFFGWSSFGLSVLGVAFLARTTLGGAITLLLTRRLTEYKLSRPNVKHFCFFLLLFVFAAVSSSLFSGALSTTCGLLICALAFVYGYVELGRVVDYGQIAAKFLGQFRTRK